MLTAILAFFTALPSLVNGVNAFTAKYFDTKVQLYAARVGGDVAIAKAMLLAEAQANSAKVSWIAALAQNPAMMFIVIGFALPFIIFEWKCVVYDIVWMSGTTSTDPIKGQLADWASTILNGIFITTTGVGVAHAFINRKQGT